MSEAKFKKMVYAAGQGTDYDKDRFIMFLNESGNGYHSFPSRYISDIQTDASGRVIVQIDYDNGCAIQGLITQDSVMTITQRLNGINPYITLSKED